MVSLLFPSLYDMSLGIRKAFYILTDSVSCLGARGGNPRLNHSGPWIRFAKGAIVGVKA